MDTNKTAYWIALGVLALGLNSEYHHGSFAALHRVAEHAGPVLCRISTRAQQTLAVARMLTSREGFPADDLLASMGGAEMARAQRELLRERARGETELLRDEIRAQADVIRARAEMRRAEIEQIRLRTRSQVRLASAVNRRVTMVCPKTGARITVNAGPGVADVSPDVEVEDTF
jgi:hypothetical protein